MSKSNHPVEHEELMAYLDGELEAGRAAQAAEHLEQCPQCRQLAADLREVSEMVAAWQVEEAERDLPLEMAIKLNQRAQEKPIRSVVTFGGLTFPLRRALAWGGALAVVSLLIIGISVPNLLRRRIAANDSSRAALERTRAVRQIGDENLQDEIRSSQAPKTANRGLQDSNGQFYAYDGNLAKRAAPSKKPRAGVGTVGKLQRETAEKTEVIDGAVNETQNEASAPPGVTGPMIIRTAELEVTTDAFDKARDGVEEMLKRHHGYVGELNVNTPAGSARSLSGTLRVPTSELEATLSDLKTLGRTENESQGGQEVTQQYVDLQARLANAKHTEQRLVEMLRDRTGKLSDVLAVEMQISRVRGEIEQMEAQRKTMKNQVDYATVTLTVSEAYKAELKAVPPTTGTQFRNAAVEGYRSLVDGIIAVLLWLLSAGPSLLVWAAILFWPAKYAWKRVRKQLAARN